MAERRIDSYVQFEEENNGISAPITTFVDANFASIRSNDIKEKNNKYNITSRAFSLKSQMKLFFIPNKKASISPISSRYSSGFPSTAKKSGKKWT